MKKIRTSFTVIILVIFFDACKFLPSQPFSNGSLKINDSGYFEMPGLNVMVFSDYYPEGHQGGVTIIQNGTRLAANGDLRLEPTPGQWQPTAKLQKRTIDKENNTIAVNLSFPDSAKNRKGYNPINYPDLYLPYQVKVRTEGKVIIVEVNLKNPLPKEWVGKVGFNLELFPGNYFGKTFHMDSTWGIFPRQFNGPMVTDEKGETEAKPMAIGHLLEIAPENKALHLQIENKKGELQLFDGRAKYNNGWFIIRSPLQANTTEGAVVWRITPDVIKNWQYKPVIHVSQVGYQNNQKKVAVIETDLTDHSLFPVTLNRITAHGRTERVLQGKPEKWGKFLRYNYLKFDFSATKKDGIYYLTYGDSKSNVFRISRDIYKNDVWQPTLEYFLPVQMCHMRVDDRYRVWHGLCHMDDARMAPLDTNHFDGYFQGNSTLSPYKPLEHVPGLNSGGWHDAGDYDLRVESQSKTVYMLSLAYEEFHVKLDETLIDQKNHLTELHQPDGKPDVLQQIEHGVLTLVGSYNSLGRMYRGIICHDLKQYVLLGDASEMTDNRIYNPQKVKGGCSGIYSDIPDDRLVFTEDNPTRELQVITSLASAYRVLKGFNKPLAGECLRISKKIWEKDGSDRRVADSLKIAPLVELYLATDDNSYKEKLMDFRDAIIDHISYTGWSVSRCIDSLGDQGFKDEITASIIRAAQSISSSAENNPFGVPYKPRIWGAGWDIQSFAIKQYFLHKTWPSIIPDTYLLNALNFVLGCHPGENSTSFVSGVGAHSVTTAYGVNRADWSYIPGGVVSGTAIIRPDFPELKKWPYFWQQTEYVMGGGATNFMFMVLAADHILNGK
jgi:endoglucanase